MLLVTTTPSIYYATPPATPHHKVDLPPWNEDFNNHQIIVHHGPPTPPPYPTVATHQPQIVYENYDTKYNVYDDEIQPKDPPPGGSSGGGFKVTEAAMPGMVLVIGIIAGALIAAIIIVIIVMKMRTRSEGGYKVDETTRTYQFTAPPTAGVSSNNPPLSVATPSVNGDDTGFETPSIVGISTLPGTKATVIPAGNGFYEKYVNNNKKSTNGKPVREWYV